MRTGSVLLTLLIALELGGVWPAAALQLETPAGEVVLTDPLVRSIQIGPPPVGQVTAFNPNTGLGLVAIPGIGVRQAQLVGVPQNWNGAMAVQAIDLETGVVFIGVLPTTPQLIPARVVRAMGSSILVRRQLSRSTVTEAVPTGSVFAAVQGGGLAPATRVRGALQHGAVVWIPPDAGRNARVIVRR